MAADRIQEVDEVLRKAITKITRNENVVITPTTTFKELGADSLDVVQIMVALEEAFDIELVDEEMKSLSNMGGFIDYVKKKVSEKAAK
jgi:acyl carrier protein